MLFQARRGVDHNEKMFKYTMTLYAHVSVQAITGWGEKQSFLRAWRRPSLGFETFRRAPERVA